VPILIFLGLSVLDLGPMYATDRRQTDWSGSVSGNVLQRMSRHKVVTVNSDGRTCNAEAVHKWTQTGTSADVKQKHRL